MDLGARGVNTICRSTTQLNHTVERVHDKLAPPAGFLFSCLTHIYKICKTRDEMYDSYRTLKIYTNSKLSSVFTPAHQINFYSLTVTGYILTLKICFWHVEKLDLQLEDNKSESTD